MKTDRKRTRKLVSIAAYMVCLLALAVGPERIIAMESKNSFKPGFRGNIQPMVGVVQSKSISDVSDENEKIDSLEQGAESETDVLIAALWEVVYTLENGSTQFYAGTPAENIVEGTFLLEAGVRQKLSGGTILSAAWIPRIPMMDDEAWTDPFLLGSNRQKTDRNSQAFRLTASSILGSPVTFRYSYATEEIDTEMSGFYLAEQPGSELTADDLLNLRRDSDYHFMEVMYDIYLNSGFIIRPQFGYMIGDADGDANSFGSFESGVDFFYPVNRWQVFGSVYFKDKDYDKTNPVFGKTREDKEYGATIGIGYAAPFGCENFMLNLITSYGEKDSNIKFYDSTSFMAGVGLAWRF